METRREALTGTTGCLSAVLGAVAGMAAFGYGFDVLAGTQTLEDCGSPC
ncbi:MULTISPECIES: hypothetical protein [Streptomyces]|uniref:Uncharacterized protein n=1 Tax=Streptomyces rubiginosohelvolus TaxID=67362 RepID=A0ABQ3C280_9ACTN|nr:MULTISPECIES: hypothetical protein [Streptomyces]GGR78729.1 hypothetical protein GCM10010284_09810 [Streptomyces rubiginosohelvolus]GGZ64571.1 hypothetical protein GCM10010328_44180 [Streptomyces pluricolorescens]